MTEPTTCPLSSRHHSTAAACQDRRCGLAKSGGTAEVIANGQPFPGGIAVDDHAVYWTAFDGTSAGGIVAKVAKRCRAR